MANSILKQGKYTYSKFRELSSIEKDSVNVFDFRNFSNPHCNNIFITCEHASNDIKSIPLQPNEKEILNTHWGYDIGAKNAAIMLGKKLNCLVATSNFSRLLIDPNRTLVSSYLIRKSIDNNYELSFNKSPNIEERINKFYIPYQLIVSEIIQNINPIGHIAVHSFNPIFPGYEPRKLEIGILYNEKSKLADCLFNHLTKKERNCRENEPYTGKAGINLMVEESRYPFAITQSITIEMRNDKIQDQIWLDTITNDICEAYQFWNNTNKN